ncbi:MAG TPA: ribonuclease J [Clostridiales bacterium]|nr:ribonuclease J [Clostridiales bacterium]
MNNKVKVTFLGGVGEIGKNMTAIEYNDEIIVIDAGLTFPGEDLPGVDVVIPDISYLKANKDKVKAIILTHGHEDHIGALPFVLNEINVPIYGSRLTLALVENKMREYEKIKYKAISVKPKNVLKLGSFTIEFIKVSHSIAGSLALCITTPVGNILHTGDFKIDFEPIDGVMTDLARIGELGKRGIKLLLCESTNVTRKGYSMSERSVGRTLNTIFEKNPDKRLFIATFASNIHRLQQILDLAEKYGRKVAFTGRSMINVSEVAMKIGELTYKKENIIDIDKVDKYEDKELLIVTTGSQGEPMSALTRMAAGEFKKIKLRENDLIVFSASPIPGNEKYVYNVINALYKLGADVIYDELAEVHASGHACQEELKTIHALAKPEFFIPVHGEYRHLRMHSLLAQQLGMQQRNIILPSLGMQVELGANSMKQCGFVTAGQRLVDGTGIGDMGSNVLSERKQLSEEGICVVVVDINNVSGTVTSDPFIITRGVVYQDEMEAFVQDAKAAIIASLKEQDLRGMEPAVIKNTIKRNMSNFIFKRTKRRPMILTIVSLD